MLVQLRAAHDKRSLVQGSSDLRSDARKGRLTLKPDLRRQVSRSAHTRDVVQYGSYLDLFFAKRDLFDNF